MTTNLNFYAGENAYSLIQNNGLSSSMVKIIAGAAGGPKWLVLSGIDRIISSEFIKKRKEPLHLIGSSIGAWRLVIYAMKNPLKAIKTFENNYINQAYRARPAPEEISDRSFDIIDSYLKDNDIKDILNHNFYRLSILAVRCKWPVSKENITLQGTGLGIAFLLNLINRNLLRFFFERTLFFDNRNDPPYFREDNFPLQKTPINIYNLKPALLASGSIPLIMSGINNIKGAPEGTYRDGGILDYHMDLPYSNNDGIILFPHFSSRIITGWLDKKIKWRKPKPANMSNVLLICPSEEFINQLPLKKIPDRNDFKIFQGNDKDRIIYWNKVVDKSRRLGDDFLEAVQSGKIKKLVKPLI